MSRPTIILIAVVVVALFVVGGTLFTVDQTQQVLITQFGRPVRVITQPGLHTKIPLVQTVIPFDKRLLNVELPGEEVILSDQRRLIVDSFAVYRIINPLRYFQAVGNTDEVLQGRLSAVVTGSLRRVMGTNDLRSVLSLDRDKIMRAIRNDVNTEMQGFGISIVDVRIRRADLPPENTQAILQRMQSERQRIAALARAKGAEDSLKIHADADRDRTVLLAEGRATADRLRGEGEAEATGIYAKAFNQDPGFFAIWRTYQGYQEALGSGNARLVITPDNAYLRYLQNPPTGPGP
jgi:modulator of FtsH protease HflC